MSTVTIEEAQAQLPELIERLATGEELVITRNARPVARLVGPISEKPQPVFGRGRGRVVIVADDEDHLKGFEDYVP
jgi:prevent-host-death family protein